MANQPPAVEQEPGNHAAQDHGGEINRRRSSSKCSVNCARCGHFFRSRHEKDHHGAGRETAGDQPGNAQAMLLEIYFKVAAGRAEEFEKMFAESYVPAMRKQQGYLRSNLLRLFRKDVAEEIEAAPTEFNYQMQLVFDTEENRRKWVASKEHATAWPLASGMAEKFSWRGFDVVAKDRK